jgi:hypothetical protein
MAIALSTRCRDRRQSLTGRLEIRVKKGREGLRTGGIFKVNINVNVW